MLHESNDAVVGVGTRGFVINIWANWKKKAAGSRTQLQKTQESTESEIRMLNRKHGIQIKTSK